MRIEPRRTLAAACLAAALGTLGFALPAAAQSNMHERRQGMEGMMGDRDTGGMMGMMQGCPMMQGGGSMGMGGGMPHLPPGNEKLELQMHADMMKAMGDIMAKYAARLPERK